MGVSESIEKTAQKLIDSLVGTHETYSPPDIDQRTAGWWHGRADPELGWAHDMADLIARSNVAQPLYLAYAADDASRYRQIKEWGYRTAVEFAGARGSGQRRRSLVESYRVDWGHQAARDGLSRALWPEMVDDIPGRDARCQQYGCGHQAFMRVRDVVENAARQARDDYKHDLSSVARNEWSRDMIQRWEIATGAEWCGVYKWAAE